MRDAGDGHAVATGQVGADRDVGVAAAHEQALDGIALVGADLEHEPAAGSQPARCGDDDRADVVEPVGPGEQRLVGLPRHDRRGDVGAARRHVGRIADDEIERRSGGQRIEPVPAGDAHVGRSPAEAGEVGVGDVEGVVAGVGEPHRDAVDRQLVGEGQTDRPRTGPEVGDHGRAGQGASEVDGDAGDHLGLRPRDQHPSVDGEVDVAERPPSEHIGQRLTGEITGDHRVEVGDHAGGRRLVPNRLEPIGAARHLAHPARRLAIVEAGDGVGEQRPPRGGRRCSLTSRGRRAGAIARRRRARRPRRRGRRRGHRRGGRS